MRRGDIIVVQNDDGVVSDQLVIIEDYLDAGYVVEPLIGADRQVGRGRWMLPSALPDGWHVDVQGRRH